MRAFGIALALLLAAAAASAEEPKRKTAVLDPKFAAGVDGAALQPLGGLVAVAVQRHAKSDVTSADDVRAMIGFERQKELLGCADTSCLAEIGGALGVDELVTTEVGLLGSRYVVNLSRIDITKARSLSRASRTVAGVDELVAALDGAVAELYGGGAGSGSAARSGAAPATAELPGLGAAPATAELPGVGAAPPASVAELPAGEESRVAPWLTTGLGVVALVVGGALYGIAQSDAGDPLVQREADALEARGNAGLGVALGGAALAAGGVLWLVAD